MFEQLTGEGRGILLALVGTDRDRAAAVAEVLLGRSPVLRAIARDYRVPESTLRGDVARCRKALRRILSLAGLEAKSLLAG